jgi:hypothetical protein
VLNYYVVVVVSIVSIVLKFLNHNLNEGSNKEHNQDTNHAHTEDLNNCRHFSAPNPLVNNEFIGIVACKQIDISHEEVGEHNQCYSNYDLVKKGTGDISESQYDH